MAIGGRTPGLVAKQGPKRVPTPPLRPSMIPGSRPANMSAPTPGRRIKPMTGQRDYGKAAPTNAAFAQDEGPI